jgi:hypothetical protein
MFSSTELSLAAQGMAFRVFDWFGGNALLNLLNSRKNRQMNATAVSSL